jgi:WD40 repeat protein
MISCMRSSCTTSCTTTHLRYTHVQADHSLQALATCNGASYTNCIYYRIEQVLTGHKNDTRSDIEACWSPDAKHVLCGSEDHSIYVWSAQDGSFESQLKGHTSAVSRVLCSPKYQVVASACTNTCLWVKQPAS